METSHSELIKSKNISEVELKKISTVNSSKCSFFFLSILEIFLGGLLTMCRVQIARHSRPRNCTEKITSPLNI